MSSLSNKFLLVVAAALVTLCLFGRELHRKQKKFRVVAIKSEGETKKADAHMNENSKTKMTVAVAQVNSSLDSMKEVEQRLRDRKENLLHECEKHSMNRELLSDVAYVKNRFLKTSLFYSDKHKILFCQIPKCGTRSQAKFLAAIEGLIRPDEFKNVSEPRATSLIEKHRSARRINNIEGMKRRMDEYAKVVIVREPFSRLLSAFRNKLENNKRGDGYAKMARRLHTTYGNGSGEELDGAPVVTLNDFMGYLTDPESHAQGDQHWNFFNRLCSPCDVKYDFIVHMDTIDNDMQYLLAKFGITNFSFPPSFDSFTDSKKVKQYFSNASPNLVNALYETYKLDYKLFGIPPPPRF